MWTRLLSFLQPTKIMATGGLVMTGAYVAYTDANRYHKMVRAFENGHLPAKHRTDPRDFFPRERLELSIRNVLHPSLSGQYYLIKGEVGSGKTRLVTHITKELIDQHGIHGKGAPLYVLCSDGKTFADALAGAVKFKFDEHINMSFLLQYMFGIVSRPEKDSNNKLLRVTDAIETAATLFVEKHNRPVVIVLDSVEWLRNSQQSLMVLQEKAKLWADANLVKMIFITNDEEVENIMKSHYSNWSRVGTPLIVGDLSQQQTLKFLQRNWSEYPDLDPISAEMAGHIYELVGGRIQDLVVFRRDHFHGKSFSETASQLKLKIYERFLEVSRQPKAIMVLQKLLLVPGHRMELSEILKLCGPEEVSFLCRVNLLKLDISEDFKIVVNFESKLIYHIIKESLHRLDI